LLLPLLFPYTPLFRSDSVLLEQSAGSEIVPGCRSFLYLPKHIFVRRLDAHQNIKNARLPIEPQELDVAHNVGCADRGEKVHRQRSEEHTSELQSRVDI